MSEPREMTAEELKAAERNERWDVWEEHIAALTARAERVHGEMLKWRMRALVAEDVHRAALEKRGGKHG